MKHTSGPWRVGNYAVNDYAPTIYNLDATKIATVEAWSGEEYNESEANAALIATAPELLEALQNMIDLWTPYLHCVGDIGLEKMMSARAAIAKAEGE